ncbi:hypothetical protein PM082_008891 [Marasmius tenuissimus]|nr:hypothetical protein PM082_008891 [Marasmius tenuissimus]
MTMPLLEILKTNLSPLQLSVSLAIAVGAFLYRVRKSRVVANIAGPESPSFLIGNLGEFLRAQAGEMDFKWFSRYGNIVRFKAPFGEDRLLISDPKAIQHILQGYNWGASVDQRARNLFVVGPGIAYVDGEDHKRHRRIMNPAFGASEAKALVPVFSTAASSLSNKWKDLLSISNDQSEVFNIPKWTSRATLDAIGHAGFDYNFGAMENQENRLSKAYHNLYADMFAAPSDGALIVGTLFSYLPISATQMAGLFEYLSKSDPRLARGREAREVAREVAKGLVEEKSKEQGSGSKDVMSFLVKANMASQNEKSRMSDEELYAQMLIIFLAGHETTANSISWTLLELSRHPEIQEKLRNEIRKKERQLISEGRSQSEFTAEDFESLSYLNAVVKESMRYHPVAIHSPRMALVDDCIPLSKSIKLTNGKEVREIPVSRGQKVVISIAGYNRSKDVFGEDAHVFRPERWLDDGESKKGGTSVGVYANLLTFSGGVHSCIGWRFALLEMQTFLVELISNFEFSLTPECDKIRREACRVMVPTIEGEVEKGGQCPLKVRCVRE